MKTGSLSPTVTMLGEYRDLGQIIHYKADGAKLMLEIFAKLY